MVRKSSRGVVLSRGLEAAAEVGRVEEIVRAAKNIDQGFNEMGEQSDLYEDVKRKC